MLYLQKIKAFRGIQLRKAFLVFLRAGILPGGEKEWKSEGEGGTMIKEKRKVRNCSIDIFRYVCAVLVVGIHTHPLSDFNYEAGYIFSDIVPRIAVPFFFAAAGYFYIQKLESGKKPFFPYVKGILATYFLWSVVYNIVIMAREHPDIRPFLASCAYRFLVTGTYEHFWFFPALLFAVCFTTLLFQQGGKRLLVPFSIFLYIIGCLGCSYYKLAVELPGLGSLFLLPQFGLARRVLLMGLPFFASGYLVYKIEKQMGKTVSKKGLYLMTGAAAAIWLAEIGMVRKFGWEDNIILTFGLYPLVAAVMLILLRNPMPAYQDFSDKCAKLAEFTYYTHPLLIDALSFLWLRLMHKEMTATPLFLLTVAATAAAWLLIHNLFYLIKKVLNGENSYGRKKRTLE